MSQQNIYQYNFKKWYVKPSSQFFDISLASDEIDFNEEVVFSTKLIGQDNGNVLPIYFDLNNSGSSQMVSLSYGDFVSGNTLVSLNYYNPNNENISCFTSSTLCDIGLTGIDNGLVPNFSGETIQFTMGLYTGGTKWDRYSFDRRTKLVSITGHTTNSDRFSGNTKETVYSIISKTGDTIGYYNQLYGGFHQGFFKLFGYDYETFPERTNKGWSVEMILRPRFEDEYYHNQYQTYLNEVYPNNKNTFFYFGTRSENKFYHHADGHPSSDSGYTRVTEGLSECLKTCKCSNSANTNSRCIEVYEPVNLTAQHNTDCNCGCNSTSYVGNPDKNPLYDSMSNTFSLRLSGDPKNPKICVKVIKLTGGCVTTGTCPTTGITYTTGYTISEYCSSNQIYSYCQNNNPNYLNKEHWFLINCVWERNKYFDTCDLYYQGGLGVISKKTYVDSISNNSVLLIKPPITHTGSTSAEEIEIVNLNEKWIDESNDRLGSLKIYVNGKLFYVINGFEEVIPRGLNTEKEKQIGVPFNISWGGGTQGLRESLTLTGCSDSTTYQQDPEVMPNNTLSGTSLSSLTTNILIEPNFAGTFDGAISQFRMYTKPLSYPEVNHNFNILKNKFELFDNRCPNCNNGLVNDIGYSGNGTSLVFSSVTLNNLIFNLSYSSATYQYRESVGDGLSFGQVITPQTYENSNYYFYFSGIDQTIKVNIIT